MADDAVKELLPIHRMVERFQCPGCINGHDVSCGSFNLDNDGLKCEGHFLGTSIAAGGVFLGSFALGLPKGFCRPGYTDDGDGRLQSKSKINIRLWLKGESPLWNELNVPVWAMERDGYLFVRTFAPRLNITWVDVIEGGTLSLVPNAIDVSKFIDKID